MPDYDDSLRTALREFAERAEPPRFATGPLIRAVARRRARFAAVSGFCALAVAATAVALPAAWPIHSGSTTLQPYTPSVAASPSQWDSAFSCGEPLPSGLPPAASGGLRIAIGAVTRTASGEPAVRWSLDAAGSAIGPVTADLLIVSGGYIYAAEPARSPVETGVASSSPLTVSSGQVYRYAPFLSPGTDGSWTAIWQHHQDYRVIIVATVWTERGGSPFPVRLSAAAALPPG